MKTPVFLTRICHRKGVEVLPDCRWDDAVGSADGQRKLRKAAQNRRPREAEAVRGPSADSECGQLLITNTRILDVTPES
jgi:hypothetical protein